MCRAVAVVAAVVLLVLGTACLAAAEEAALSYLEDPTASLTVDAAASRDFVPMKSYFAKGFTRSAHWVRIAPRRIDEPYLLSVVLPILDDVRLYTQDPDGRWHEARSGDRVPFAARPVQSPFLGFELNPGDLERPAYLRIVTAGTTAARIDLMPLREGLLDTHRSIILHAATFGLQVVAIAICLVVYVPLRDRLFLWFAAMQVIWLSSAFIFNGYASVLFPHRSTDLAYSAVGTLSFLVEMVFHLAVLARFAPRRGLYRLTVGIAAAAWVIVPLLWLHDISLALQARSIASLVVILLLAALAATARRADLMPLGLLRGIYALYVGLVLLWMLPLLGLMEFGKVSFHAVVLHGSVNLGLILTVVLLAGIREQRRVAQAREALRAAEAERAVGARVIEAQSGLIRMLAHEVGTALSVIRYALVKESLGERNRARIGKAIDGLDHTIRNLVDSDRIAAGGIEVRPAPTDLRAMVEGVADLFAEDRIVLSPAPAGEEAPVETDPDLLRLVLHHLIDNACKYGAEGTPVRIAIGAGAPGRARITIRNALRPGPLPDMARIRTIYFRDPHVLALPGTGVGLSVAGDIAAQLGADLTLSIEGGDFLAVVEIKAC